jgi:beta-1,4-mannosyltransferase
MRLCDHAIVHSYYARRRVGQRYGDVEKVVVIPHGNYVNVFPREPRSRGEIRLALALPQRAFVFLAFGQVRPYKQLVELVFAFRKLNRDNIRLLVAGEPTVPAEAARLRSSARNDERVILDLRRIPTEEVSAMHRAADAAVLAYRDFFSSGALLLALSYGLPVVAPGVGTAPELVRPPGIETFSPGELAAALDRMRNGDPGARSRAALQAAQQCSWERVGDATVALYRRACARAMANAEAA